MATEEPRVLNRIRRVADQFRKSGYQVVERPEIDALPDWLAGYSIDILASGHDESVVVEVKSRASMVGDPATQALAESVRHHPGWRFQLEVTNPVRRLDGFSNTTLLSRSRLERRLAEVRTLAAEHSEAAFLLAWSCVEATLRLAAIQADMHLANDSPRAMIKRLTLSGVLRRRHYEWLLRALELRNALVHGLQSRANVKLYVPRLLALSDELLEGVFDPDVEMQ
ncbi:MAG TPA: hypothetical protein VNG93_10945 [Candidatus Dormibacteraeota bacterium]|nr:hypothetical protein [Candidatus Dormibacteraeota bacterium]